MAIGGFDIESELAKLAPLIDLAPQINLEERMSRIVKAQLFMAENGADAILIGAGKSLNYFTGLEWGASERFVGMLLPSKGVPVFFCPYFELGSLEAEVKIKIDIRLWQEDENPFSLVAKALRENAISKLAIEPSLSFEFLYRLGKEIVFDALDGSHIINNCRMYKSATEIAIMQQAKSMTLEVHKATSRIMREGISNFEVIDFIDKAHRKLGANGNSFCIVQFGVASAYPHGLPGVQYLKENDIILVDTGCYLHGYTSDITRTYVLGKASTRQEEIWKIEKEAQLTAFESAKIGATCESVDYAARAVLEKYNLGPDYRLPGLPHRTGHGIGLSIHEPAYLVRGDKTLLAEGMCFSNEPMIVIPEDFGIRLEDHMYITEEGAKWFTKPQENIYEV